MKLQYSLACCALFLLFTACVPETSLNVTSTENQEEVTPTALPDNQFALNDQITELYFAYINSEQAEDGLYEHQLILTRAQALVDGDLRNRSAAAAFTFLTADPSPLGSFVVKAPQSDRDAGMIIALGSSLDFSFGERFDQLVYPTYMNGNLTIADAGAGTFRVEADLNWSRFLKIRGAFQGDVVDITIEPEAAPTAEDFTGQNYFRYSDDAADLTNAYLIKRGESDGLSSYELFLSKRDIARSGTQLTGNGDVMLFRFPSAPALTSGRYQINNSAGGASGYFSRQSDNRLTSSYFCSNMNFSTSSAADDEPMDDGESLLLVDGDNFRVRFNFDSRYGHTIEGEFSGTVINASY